VRKNLWGCDMIRNLHLLQWVVACATVKGEIRFDQDREARRASNAGIEVGATNTRSGGIFPCW
jgi:hypothetical protein